MSALDHLSLRGYYRCPCTYTSKASATSAVCRGGMHINSTLASGFCTSDPENSFSLPPSSAKKKLAGSGLQSAVSTTSMPIPLEASFDALLLCKNQRSWCLKKNLQPRMPRATHMNVGDPCTYSCLSVTALNCETVQLNIDFKG